MFLIIICTTAFIHQHVARVCFKYELFLKKRIIFYAASSFSCLLKTRADVEGRIELPKTFPLETTA